MLFLLPPSVQVPEAFLLKAGRLSFVSPVPLLDVLLDPAITWPDVGVHVQEGYSWVSSVGSI